MVEAIAWLRNDQNKPEAIKIFGRFTRTQDEALLQRTYELSRKASRMVPYATEGGLRNILDFAPASDGKNLAPENFLDNSFLRQLESSGYIKSLYGKSHHSLMVRLEFGYYAVGEPVDYKLLRLAKWDNS